MTPDNIDRPNSAATQKLEKSAPVEGVSDQFPRLPVSTKPWEFQVGTGRQNTLDLQAGKVGGGTLLLAELTEIHKSNARRMENLAGVRDGSSQPAPTSGSHGSPRLIKRPTGAPEL